MKKNLLLFLILTLTFIGCEDVNSDRYIDSKIQTSTKAITLPNTESGSTTFTLTVSAEWVINSSDTKSVPSWFSVAPFSGGAGTTLITVTANGDNKTMSDRTGYLKIHSGGLTKIISVTQPGHAPVVVNVKLAGTLGSILTDAQKKSITHIKLTGTINAADFLVMRDKMPILSAVDLSDVSIDKNKIPDFAFSCRNPAGPDAYWGKATLTQILLPRTITEIGNYAFAKCYELGGSLIIPDGVTSIGDGVFLNCNFVGPLNLPNNLTSIGDDAFHWCHWFTGSLTIPGGVTKIGNRSFMECRGLNGTLTICEGVTTIGDGAFVNGGYTGALILPNSITSIGSQAFAGCGLFRGPLIIPQGVEVIADEAFMYFGQDGSLFLPESIKIIGVRAFAWCSLRGTLVFPSGVTSIGEEAFMWSEFSGTLSIPGSVVSIGKRAFYECRGLNGSLILSDGLRIIEDGAFLGCSNFRGTLVIPSSVTSIGDRALGSLGQIEKVRVSWITPISYLEYMIPAKSVEVPLVSLELYKAAPGWKNHSLVGY